MPKPALCRMVLYRSRTARYSLAAVISATPETLYEPGVKAGFVPPITDDGRDRVHLTVFTPGKPGNRLPGTDPRITADAQGGSYPESDIPYWEPPTMPDGASEAPAGSWSYDDQPPGTWTWPPRV